METRVNYEPSVWMRDALARRFRQARDVLVNAKAVNADVVMLSLTDPPEEATDEERARWETQCDRCGKDCVMGPDFHTGTVTVDAFGQHLHVTFGLCGDCQAKEQR